MRANLLRRGTVAAALMLAWGAAPAQSVPSPPSPILKPPAMTPSQSGSSGPTSQPGTLQPPGTFDNADTDRDGRLSPEEFYNAWRNFAR